MRFCRDTQIFKGENYLKMSVMELQFIKLEDLIERNHFSIFFSTQIFQPSEFSMNEFVENGEENLQVVCLSSLMGVN
jgi:hypothetical protein